MKLQNRMKYIKEYKIFESDSDSDSDLRGSMDVESYNSVTADISDILLDLTDEHYNFRTTLNGVENPTSNLVSNYFGVEIYNQTSEGARGWYLGNFKWDDVSEYVHRIYDYMVASKWITDESKAVVGGSPVSVWSSAYVQFTYYINDTEYKIITDGWSIFLKKIEEYKERYLRSIKIYFTLGV